MSIITKKAYPPTRIDGCQLWMDGADTSSMTLSGSTVTTWRDKSGKGNDATANGSPQLSAGGIITSMNTSPGANFYINSLSQTITGGVISVSFVATVNQFTGSGLNWQYGRIVSFGDGTTSDFAADDFTICQDANTESVGFYSGGGQVVNFGITYGVPFLFTVILDGTNANFYINGTSEYTTALTKSLHITQIGLGVNIATKSWPNDCLQGVISEVVVFNTALTTSQQQFVEFNLAKKWYLNVPFTFPVSIKLVENGSLRLGIMKLQQKFSPTSLANLSLWLDASDSSSISVDSGNNITQWNDKSNGLIAYVNSAYGRDAPTYNSSSSPKYVSMTPNQAMVIANFPLSTAWSVFSCMSNVSIGSRWFISPYADVQLVMLSMGANGNKIFSGLLGGDGDITGSHIEFTSAENTNGYGSYTYYRDGSLISSNNTSYSVSATSVHLGIGANGNSGYDCGGTYEPFEILIYNHYLTDSERQKVEGYLAWKWGLQGSLPAGHPYLSFPP